MIERLLGRYSECTFASLRIAAGLLFWCHGLQKFGMFGGMDGADGVAPIMTPFWFAGLIEVTAGLAIAVGFLTRYAAFLASGEMAAAFFIAHFPQGWLPLTNGGELAALYCFLWLYLAARGPGIWSLDTWLGVA